MTTGLHSSGTRSANYRWLHELAERDYPAVWRVCVEEVTNEMNWLRRALLCADLRSGRMSKGGKRRHTSIRPMFWPKRSQLARKARLYAKYLGEPWVEGVVRGWLGL